MRLIKTQFKGLKLIKGKTFHDSRGFFREILRYKILKNNSMLYVIYPLESDFIEKKYSHKK